MNARALALGAMIGFVAAIAPSCSAPKCGPANCDGCCDSKGACVKKPNNGNNTSCGAAGNTCVDCAAAGSTCNPSTGACAVTGTGGSGGGATGGGSGGGGGSTCDGCRLPSGTCVPLASTTTNNCGSGGNTCQMCAAGKLCTNGTCMDPPATVAVGSACTADTDCRGTLGATAICKKMTSSGNGTYNGGYCTLPCTGTCPSGSRCVRLEARYGEADAICWDLCGGANGACRTTEGYACYGLGSFNACWLDPLPAQDAGTPADKVGNPCTADSQCQNPPETGGACLGREFNYNWEGNGGYCTRVNCQANSECASDGGALCLGFSDNDSLCVQRCPDSSDGGQGTCRNGFVCEAYFVRQADGGITRSTDGYCIPPEAPIPTTIGGTCATNGDCQVPDGSIADCVPGTFADGGATPFTGGYCTRFSCEDDDQCGPADAGNRCFFSQDSSGNVTSRCYGGCAAAGAGQSSCRTGYACRGYGLEDGGDSTDGYCDPSCANFPANYCPTGYSCNAGTGYCTDPDGGIL